MYKRQIEDIKYGMIILKNGVFGKRYIKIMEIMPLNYHLRSTKEKNMIIDNFKSLVKIAPQSFEICLTSMDTDTSEMIGNIKKSTDVYKRQQEIGDLRAATVIFMGGGSILLKPYILNALVTNKEFVDFIEEDKANAIGYEMIARDQLKVKGGN